MIGGRDRSVRAVNTGLGRLLPRRRLQSTLPVPSESGTQREGTSVVTREASGEPGGTGPEEEKQPASSRAASVVGVFRSAREGVEACQEGGQRAAPSGAAGPTAGAAPSDGGPVGLCSGMRGRLAPLSRRLQKLAQTSLAHEGYALWGHLGFENHLRQKTQKGHELCLGVLVIADSNDQSGGCLGVGTCQKQGEWGFPRPGNESGGETVT